MGSCPPYAIESPLMTCARIYKHNNITHRATHTRRALIIKLQRDNNDMLCHIIYCKFAASEQMPDLMETCAALERKLLLLYPLGNFSSTKEQYSRVVRVNGTLQNNA